MAKPLLETGQTIDGFLVGPQLHKGGMAILWEVTKPGIDLPLVMKVPVLFDGEDPAAIVGFEMEQMILPRLVGPHVPRFVASGDFAVQPYIVMERVPGPSLITRLETLPLPVDDVARLGVAIARALDDLHRQHVVHLDVKPSNILFRDSGEAVLIDFGLSRHDQLPDLMEEEFRLPYGTAPYMAPEQVLGARHDPRSDLFALGALMYFFATGERPFGNPQRLSGLKRRIWRDPAPPRALNAEVPAWLQEIILRCLEVDPDRRHPTAAQLAFDLAHPEQVELTARAGKMRKDSLTTVWRRRVTANMARPVRRGELAAQIANAPIVVAALDLSDGNAALAEALRVTAARVLQMVPGARLACLNVLKQNRITLDSSLDDQGNSKHVQRLVDLKHWAGPLGLGEGKVTFHVLEAIDPAAAILDYVRANNVDHVVMGARANSTMRTILGSVSGEIAAQAPCSVTVVRTRQRAN